MAARMPYPKNKGRATSNSQPPSNPVKTRQAREAELMSMNLADLITLTLTLKLTVPLVPTINGLVNMILTAEGY